jgi:hypothetical protein
MAKVHRQVFERLGTSLRSAVLLDTPYGFQSNASDISSRAVTYFRESTRQRVEVATLTRAEGADPMVLESAQARVAEAQWVFAGPGSPTYALRQWRVTVLPRLFAEKLSQGGCVAFSSAAALTLGRWTVPVYEIYKAGADPEWADGLDLLSPFGLNVAVIPHYDNAEGGTHDTRYCYLGEGRLRLLESQLPSDGWVLGVDEHTACIFDLDAGTVAVLGLGSVTVRARAASVPIAAGETLGIDQLVELATAPTERSGAWLAGPSGDSAAPGSAPLLSAPVEVGPGSVRGSPLMAETTRLSVAFDESLARRDSHAATEAALELEGALHAWSADTFESDELDRARAAFRRTVLRLGEAAGPGLRDPRQLVAPWVEALLAERDEARSGRRFADADRIRRRLDEAGVEVRDTPGGTEWDLRERPGAPA